jgi:hypothetical protein
LRLKKCVNKSTPKYLYSISSKSTKLKIINRFGCLKRENKVGPKQVLGTFISNAGLATMGLFYKPLFFVILYFCKLVHFLLSLKWGVKTAYT